MMLFFNRKRCIAKIKVLGDKWLRLICKVTGENYDEHKDILFTDDQLADFTNPELRDYRKKLEARIKCLEEELSRRESE